MTRKYQTSHCERTMRLAGEEVQCNQGTKEHETHVFRFLRSNGVVSTYKRTDERS